MSPSKAQQLGGDTRILIMTPGEMGRATGRYQPSSKISKFVYMYIMIYTVFFCYNLNEKTTKVTIKNIFWPHVPA